MKQSWARLMATLGTAALVASCASFQKPQPLQDGAQAQILVMVKEAPVRHFLPGGNYASDYQTSAPPAAVANVIRAVNHDYRLAPLEDWFMPSLGLRCYLMALSPGQSAADTVRRLSLDQRVESVEAVQQFRTQRAQGTQVHNDAYYGLQTSAKSLKLDQLHQFATGRQIRIALIDSQVEAHHPDLDQQIIESVNLVDQSAATSGEAHGTEVAGIMVAKADNSIGIAGVAPAARLLALRACWFVPGGTGDVCNSFTLAKALQYAIVHQAHIVNMSLAGPPDRLLTRLIDKAVEQGIVVISAVDPASPDDSFPARLPEVIAVSSMGEKVPAHAIAAPGLRVLTTTPPKSWGFVSGSSFATAHVSGVAALMLEISPKLSPQAIAQMLQQQGQQHLRADHEPWIDACALVSQLANKPCASCRCDNQLYSGR